MRVYQPAAQVASVEILDPNAPTADKKSGWAKRAEEVIASLPLIFLSHFHRLLCFGEKSLGCSFHDQKWVVHQTDCNGASTVCTQLL